MSRPLLRYAGGKKWMIKPFGESFLRYLNFTQGMYIDPFLGGGAIPLWLGDQCVNNLVLSDLLEPLVEFYKVLQAIPGELAQMLSAFAIEGTDRDTFNKIRDTGYKKPVQRAAQFLYLNKLNFNGLVRYNRSGKSNVPYAEGRAETFDQPWRKSQNERKGRDAIDGGLWTNKQHMLDASASLLCASINHMHFSNQDFAKKGDLLYLDPPYHKTFVGYTPAGFTDWEQEELADMAEAAANRGAWVVAHNSDTPEVRKWWSWATNIGSSERRQINSDGEKRGKVPCTLWTNKPDLLVDW